MYIHFSRHIYLAFYNDDIVCLDLKKDEYTIFNKKISEAIRLLLNSQVEYHDGKYHLKDEFDDSIKKLINAKILQKTLYDAPDDIVINSKLSAGSFSYDWSLEGTPQKCSFKDVCLCLLELTKIRILLKCFGLNYVIKLIKRKKIKVNNGFSEDNNYYKIANDLNYSCLFFPAKTKCLEWAMTYLFLALRKKYRCNLVIGVQTMPFIAHAWVDVNGKTLCDSSDLPEESVVILSEPF